MRQTWLDVAKGVGIVLVVLAHVLTHSKWQWAPEVYFTISLFYMPFFFVISGYLFTASDRQALLSKRIRGLLIPYVAFLGLIITGMLLVDVFRGDIPAPWQIRHLMTEAVLGGRYLTRELGVFWFVTCLFATQLLYNEVALRSKGPTDPVILNFVAGSVVLAYVIQAAWPEIRSPLALSNVPLAIGAFWFGHLLREGKPGSIAIASAAIAVFGVSIAAASAGFDFTFSMKNTKFGPPVLGLLLALAISVAVLGLIRLIARDAADPIAPVAELGKASLVIMFAHQFVHFTLRESGLTSDLPLIVLSIGVPYLLYRLLKSSAVLSPWFLGEGSLSLSVHRMRRTLASRAK
ncbi:fucose 4-O-acetylase-like acetyltransferase [Sinorhizobium kostiense]|uniref:Fucose 4-O-acetylase-like acetyltransferase n=1 Tax=Sinorhizobium kostiense TaxID=76747 RepID=A0ABS4QTN1_9HYPH|nr:acyltransferase family protein [Sinorhizobium kostiense]MBP2234012.1 fucose 4-O-acetylase-like acetyltransferase [Sinorhizobium kostiense]